MFPKLLLLILFYQYLFVRSFYDCQMINRYDTEHIKERYKRSSDDSISLIKEKYFKRSTALKTSINEILTSEKLRYAKIVII